jgi:predicted membrane channel-forming protein YqfA (hemolysin III family)
MEATTLIILFVLAGIISFVYYVFIKGETNTIWIVLFIIAGMIFCLNSIYNSFNSSIKKIEEERIKVLEDIGNQN